MSVPHVLAVAGVFLAVVLHPAPPPLASLQQRRQCGHRLSSIARRIVHQVNITTTIHSSLIQNRR